MSAYINGEKVYFIRLSADEEFSWIAGKMEHSADEYCEMPGYECTAFNARGESQCGKYKVTFSNGVSDAMLEARK